MIEKINEIGLKDPEAAHVIEDTLYAEFVQWVSERDDEKCGF